MSARPSPPPAELFASATVPRLDSWLAITLVTLLLLLGTVPVAEGVGPAAVLEAVVLSLAGGLALRRPGTASVVIAVVLTLALLVGPAVGSAGMLAGPIAVAATAAKGRMPLALGTALWQVAASVAGILQSGTATDNILAQITIWVLLQVTALLAGAWGRELIRSAGRERTRRIEDLAEQRRAIARELHDTGVRSMAQVVMLAETAAHPGRELRAPGRHAPTTSEAAALARISSIARDGTEQMRELLEELRRRTSAGESPVPPSPARAGSLMQRSRDRLREEGFDVQLSTEGSLDSVSGPQPLLARCLGEIEANVLRHGERSSPVAILLEVRSIAEAAPMIELAVLNGVMRSDRRGRDTPEDLPGGVGLLGMGERLREVGGHLTTRREGDTYLTRVLIPAAVPRSVPGVVAPPRSTA
ncbi:histidine kinase [Brachybacterium squillarum]|uniref:histidine kinase n=1 Tax=Brachybacterium squillarum TaxID=661979 RepID=UPI0002629393|nr:histidine kinase [Brachybacterium squillarum]